MDELVDGSSTNESINYVSSFYISVRTEDRTLPRTVRMLLRPLVVMGTFANSLETEALCRIRV
jgi:hypothetical protein